jgi:hypothetical protein
MVLMYGWEIHEEIDTQEEIKICRLIARSFGNGRKY